MREQLNPFEFVPLGEPDLKQEQWFEAGIAIGRKRQQSDIIKLLETDCKNASIEFAIALIKGENK